VSRQRHIAVLFLSSVLLTGISACGGGGGGSETNSGSSAGSVGNGPGSATLAWSAPTDGRVTGFRVYVGASSGSYQPKGNGFNAGDGTSFTVTGLDSGKTYYFAVTSYDGSGNESSFSAEATKKVN
jgi:hypothetical protein